MSRDLEMFMTVMTFLSTGAGDAWGFMKVNFIRSALSLKHAQALCTRAGRVIPARNAAEFTAQRERWTPAT
jgi:hypothetical protein